MTKNSKKASNNVLEYMNKLKTSFQELQHAHLNKLNVEDSLNDEKYYFLEAETKFIGFKQVLHTEQHPYIVKEPYVIQVRATHEKKWFRFPGITPCTIHDHSNSLDDIYVDYTSHSVPNFLYNQVCIKKQTRKYNENEIEYEYQTKYKDVIKYQQIEKCNNIPEYDSILIKKFDQVLYEQDIKHSNDNIVNKKEAIVDLLNQIKSTSDSKQSSLLQIIDMIIDSTKEFNSLCDYNNEYLDSKITMLGDALQ